jgi:hypothetical protein
MGMINKPDLAVVSSPSRWKRYGQLFNLAPTVELLTSGGDTRIVCDPAHGQNKYGCLPWPEPNVLAYGSSTASTITPGSFAAAERLRRRLQRDARIEGPSNTYARELTRVRAELLDLCDLADIPGVDIVFAASGTDLHLIAAQLASDVKTSALLAVMIEATETGRGVPAALAGRHFSDCTALGSIVASNTAILGGGAIEVAAVASRAADGTPRAAALIDAEVEALVASAAMAGRRVLLNLIDVSKTGMIAPSLACALELRRRFPAAVDVMVDGCQFRLAPSTLRAYLQHGFWIALTGSKFVGGPAFSGALILPYAAARRLRTRHLPPALSAYSARADWPLGWTVRQALADVENFGLLLRWEAALAELRTFRSLSEAAITAFLEAFAGKVRQRLTTDPIFQLLPVPNLDRRPLVNVNSWDHTPTIFPFILRRAPSSQRLGAPLSRMETARVYELLRTDRLELANLNPTATTGAIAVRRCQLGQPVHCGTIDGVPVSALRLCVSIPLVVDAVSQWGRGAEIVNAEGLLALDKAALLSSTIDRLGVEN